MSELRNQVLALRQGIAEVRTFLEQDSIAPEDRIVMANLVLGQLLSSETFSADVPTEDGGQTFDNF